MSNVQMAHYLVLELLYWGVFTIPLWVIMWRLWMSETLQATSYVVLTMLLCFMGQLSSQLAQQPDMDALKAEKAAQTQAIDE